MTFQSLLIDTATTKRATSTTTDNYGNPVETYSNYLVNQPCRFGPSKGRTIWRDQQNVVVDYIVYFNNIDIVEGDLIYYNSGTYRVLFVEQSKSMTTHHLECGVQIVRAL